MLDACIACAIMQIIDHIQILYVSYFRSSTNSLLGSAGDLTTLVNDGEPQQVNGMNNLSPQQANVTANNINTHSPGSILLVTAFRDDS